MTLRNVLCFSLYLARKHDGSITAVLRSRCRRPHSQGVRSDNRVGYSHEHGVAGLWSLRPLARGAFLKVMADTGRNALNHVVPLQNVDCILVSRRIGNGQPGSNYRGWITNDIG